MTVDELADILDTLVGSDIPVYADYANQADKPPDSGYLVVRQAGSRPSFVRETDYPISETQSFMLHAYALKNVDTKRVMAAGEQAALRIRDTAPQVGSNNLFVRFGTRSSGHDIATKRARFTASRILTVRHANTN